MRRQVGKIVACLGKRLGKTGKTCRHESENREGKRKSLHGKALGTPWAETVILSCPDLARSDLHSTQFPTRYAAYAFYIESEDAVRVYLTILRLTMRCPLLLPL